MFEALEKDNKSEEECLEEEHAIYDLIGLMKKDRDVMDNLKKNLLANNNNIEDINNDSDNEDSLNNSRGLTGHIGDNIEHVIKENSQSNDMSHVNPWDANKSIDINNIKHNNNNNNNLENLNTHDIIRTSKEMLQQDTFALNLSNINKGNTAENNINNNSILNPFIHTLEDKRMQTDLNTNKKKKIINNNKKGNNNTSAIKGKSIDKKDKNESRIIKLKREKPKFSNFEDEEDQW
jgi:hypothetical protein